MKTLNLLVIGAAMLAAAPAQAQCGGNHGGHGGGHGKPQPSEPYRSKMRATNTLCPVMGESVKPGKHREVVVGGNLYLVCHDTCGPELAEHKEKYLDKDGRPLNAPKEEPKEQPAEPAPAPEHKH